MMFRKLYWVTELVMPDGTSRVLGIFTSIPDLIRNGLRPDCFLRLTLSKLDCQNEPIGCWSGPDYEGLESALVEFVETDEFSREHCNALVEAVHHSVAA